MKQIYCGKPQNSGYQGWELCKVVGVTGKEPWVQSTIPYLKKKSIKTKDYRVYYLPPTEHLDIRALN
jgi:hypothetical protein